MFSQKYDPGTCDISEKYCDIVIYPSLPVVCVFVCSPEVVLRVGEVTDIYSYSFCAFITP